MEDVVHPRVKPPLDEVQSLLGVTPQAARDAWFAKLVGLSAADAAALIKVELARRGG
ncbi:MAG: hypothetical protein R3B06_03875 [Kofleriaceae bacterium]